MAKNESTKPEVAEQAVTPRVEKIVRSGTVREQGETNLTDHQIVQRRTPDLVGRAPWPADGRFHRVFHVSVARTSTGTGATSDWTASEYDSMHEANKIAVLQEAMNNGLHPRGEATFDGAGELAADGSGSVDLEYSVECVPASVETPEETAALTLTPSKAIEEQGGTTLRDGAELTTRVGSSVEPETK